ncbi:class I SAM-dependent DNA methyltransferase [Sulfitobacter aestuariivivens]|uniref:Methyltransferase domain-containing protein n=1 Tax=Sulfitobacter aestuariivivens TaxID=2766981 RepID=A0A927HDS0_9RHOB|nr:methyltransferase domain-containing protein [Sulfitobacter aestuariivivens]MBD3663131.1 methyltransferase domain-containing protein [Sulfitobacter aestuariivivens]
MTETFLDKAYSARDARSTRKLYDDWAESYEEELGKNGYATPARCAKALAEFSDNKSAPVLDFGCGTGLSGVALKREGFSTIDGLDLSADMLARARDKNIYRDLQVIEAKSRLSHKPGAYAAIAAIGVIGAGAAPIETFDALMRGLARGGHLVLSFNDHALDDPRHEARLNEWLDCGAATLLFREHGDHIPGIDIGSNVYVIEKN